MALSPPLRRAEGPNVPMFKRAKKKKHPSLTLPLSNHPYSPQPTSSIPCFFFIDRARKKVPRRPGISGRVFLVLIFLWWTVVDSGRRNGWVGGRGV